MTHVVTWMRSGGYRPKRHEVAGDLRAAIIPGTYPHGTLLRGENELAAAGLVPTRGDQWIAAAALEGADASLLGRASGEWFLSSVRIARAAEGRFVEKVVSWLDPIHFRLNVSFGS